MPAEEPQLTPEAKEAIRAYLFKILGLFGGVLSVALFFAGFFIRDVAIAKAEAQAQARVFDEVLKVAEKTQKFDEQITSSKKKLDEASIEIAKLKEKIATKEDELRVTTDKLVEADKKVRLIDNSDIDKASKFLQTLKDAGHEVKKLMDLCTEIRDKRVRISSGYHQVRGKEAWSPEGNFSKYSSEKIPFGQNMKFNNQPEIFLIKEMDDIQFRGDRIYIESTPIEVTNEDFRIQLKILQPGIISGNTKFRWLAIGE